MTVDPKTQEIRRLRQALRRLYAWTGIIDNGTCALCGGHRRWRTGPKRNARRIPEPCENLECLSHEIERLLAPTRGKRCPPPRIGLPPCPTRERPPRSQP